MIPLSPISEIPFIFGIKLHLFGLLVATGVILGFRYALNRGEKLRVPEKEIVLMCFAVLITGFTVSHWVEALLYRWDELVEKGPLYLLNILDSMSSFGGMFGAILGYTWYKRRVKGSSLPFMDIMVGGFAIGWVFGRLGCTFAFDHPGTKTDFFLAFQYTDGARHNLGFYEFLFTLFVVMPTIWFLNRRNEGLGPRPGLITAMLIFEYVPVRFLWDFFRAQDVEGADPRYFGFTAGHYASVILLALGIWIYRASKQLPEDYLVKLRDQKLGGFVKEMKSSI